MDIPRNADLGKGFWDTKVITVDALVKRESELSNLPVAETPTRLFGGSNRVYLVSFEGGSRGVFKPGDGERHLWEIPESHGKLYLRERAAYLVSRKIKFNLIPPTILREIEDEENVAHEGSVQDFIPDPKGLIWDVDPSDVRQQLFELAIFDYIIWNKDRKQENFFIKDKKLHAADNGLSFDRWPSGWIPDNLSDYARGESVPEDLMVNIRSFLNSPQDQRDLQAELLPLVPRQTIDMMYSRIKKTHSVLSKGKVTNYDIEQMSYEPL